MAGPVPAIDVLKSETAAGRASRYWFGQHARGSLRRQFLGLGDPAVDAAGKPDLFANIVGGLRVEFGDLRIVENAQIVELLFDRRRNAGQFLEIVSNAAWPGQLLEAEVAGCWRCWHGLGNDRPLGRTNVHAHFTLRAGNSVNGGLGNKIAVQRHRATGVVIARHDKSDASRIAIGVNDGGDRNIKPLRLFDGDVFLVGVDNEQEVGYATHDLDATERTIELVPLALHGETLFLGVARRFTGIEHLVELAQSRDRSRDRFPVGQSTAQPTRIDVILRAAFGGICNRVLRLAFGADEQNAAAFCDGVADSL